MRRPRLSYANVVATLALAAALGGGAALALSGSGSIQRATVAPGFNDSETLLRLHGIGRVRAACDDAGFITNYLRNDSGRRLAVSGLAANESAANPGAYYYWEEVPDGQEIPLGGIGGGEGLHATWYVSIFPAGKSARPQATLTLNVEKGCSDGQVSALATNTEEAG